MKYTVVEYHLNGCEPKKQPMPYDMGKTNWYEYLEM